MKATNRLRVRLFSALIFSAAFAVIGEPRKKAVENIKSEFGASTVAVDWEKFLSRHDLVWKEIPKAWHEGAFIGNGLLGAMIYSDGTNALQWDVGRSDVVDQGQRLAIGRFVLNSTNKAAKGTMRLDLWNAEAQGTISGNGSETKWRSFTHADKLVNVIELTGSSDQTRFVFQHLPAITAREEFRNEPVPEDRKNPPPTFGEKNGVQWCLQPFKAGGGYAVAWIEKRISDHRRALFFTVDFKSSGKPTVTKAIADVRSASSSSIERLAQSHRQWWHHYYPQSFLSLPDTRMESFYWIQMYKLASATRPNRPAIDLMGPWFRRTPWPRIWWNLNLQLAYWPVYTANRLELGKSLTHLIDSNRKNLINNVPVEWRHDSAMVRRTSSYDCKSPAKTGMDGKEGEEYGNLTWALHNYWLQYRYSGDEKMLRDGLYPILKRAVGNYLHLLKLGEDGKLHLPLAISPEYPELATDTNYDLALLRWGLQTLLATSERLNLREASAARWREVLEKLTPFPVDEKSGFMVGAGVPFTKSHRHFSHLMMFYPLHLIDPESSVDRPLIEKSLDHWQSLKSSLRGYSFTGGSAMSAWLDHKDEAVQMLDEILDFRPGMAKTKYNVTANTMYVEAGPVIETPLAGAASIHEMVLQSWSMEPFGTHIRVFPAVPEKWKDVSFDKLLAEGAFEISAVRQNGKTKFVQIKSLRGAPCRVETGLAEPIAASGNRKFKVISRTDHNGHRLTEIDLRKGETVLLTSENKNSTKAGFIIEPVVAQPDRLNFYGSP